MESSAKTAVVYSYAKINLTLDVLGIRPDGYHAIESVMQTVGLHDTLTLTPRDDPGINIICSTPGIPTDERNLAHKAASLMLAKCGVGIGLDIHMEKRTPSEAGLGGGSSNAAAVLTGLHKLLDLVVGPDEMLGIAAQIGSDVPFFLAGGTALVRGRGEEALPLPDMPEAWIAILKPSFGVSTPWAYKRLDEMRTIARERSDASKRMTKCIRAGEWDCIPELLSNDLELPALERHPQIGRLKNELLNAGASAALMCGSGSAVFGLFDSESQAQAAAKSLAKSDIQTFVVRTISSRERPKNG